MTCKLLPSGNLDTKTRRGQQNAEWREQNRTRQLCGDCERIITSNKKEGDDKCEKK